MRKLVVITGLISVLLLTGCDKPQKVQIATYTQQSPVDPVDLNLLLKKEVLDREKIEEDVSKHLDRIDSHLKHLKYVPTYSCTTYYNGNDSIDICK